MRTVEGRGRAAGGRAVLIVVQSGEGGGQAQISGGDGTKPKAAAHRNLL
jgi:hypothetical protein